MDKARAAHRCIGYILLVLKDQVVFGQWWGFPLG